MAVKAVLFDMDGTLADSMELVCSLTMKVIEELKLPTVRKSLIKNVIARPGEMVFKQLFPKHTNMLERARKLYFKHYREALPKIREIPGAKETLFTLHDLGLKIGIITVNFRPLAVKYIEHLGIFCDTLVAFGDTRLSRPNPHPLVQALKDLKVKPEEALYVGDTPDDILQGRAANVMTIGISTGMFSTSELRRETPDFLVKDLNEIPDIIKKLE